MPWSNVIFCMGLEFVSGVVWFSLAAGVVIFIVAFIMPELILKVGVMFEEMLLTFILLRFSSTLGMGCCGGEVKFSLVCLLRQPPKSRIRNIRKRISIIRRENINGGRMFMKLHKTQNGTIVAACDEDLIGKVLEERDICMDLDKYRDFYMGSKVTKVELMESLKSFTSANLVGKEATDAAVSMGLAENVIYIKKIPYIQIYNI